MDVGEKIKMLIYFPPKVIVRIKGIKYIECLVKCLFIQFTLYNC